MQQIQRETSTHDESKLHRTKTGLESNDTQWPMAIHVSLNWIRLEQGPVCKFVCDRGAVLIHCIK